MKIAPGKPAWRDKSDSKIADSDMGWLVGFARLNWELVKIANNREHGGFC